MSDADQLLSILAHLHRRDIVLRNIASTLTRRERNCAALRAEFRVRGNDIMSKEGATPRQRAVSHLARKIADLQTADVA